MRGLNQHAVYPFGDAVALWHVGRCGGCRVCVGSLCVRARVYTIVAWSSTMLLASMLSGVAGAFERLGACRALVRGEWFCVLSSGEGGGLASLATLLASRGVHTLNESCPRFLVAGGVTQRSLGSDHLLGVSGCVPRLLPRRIESWAAFVPLSMLPAVLLIQVNVAASGLRFAGSSVDV